jgi:hypothetical protein
VFYYLLQDIKSFTDSLINLHFEIKSIKVEKKDKKKKKRKESETEKVEEIKKSVEDSSLTARG